MKRFALVLSIAVLLVVAGLGLGATPVGLANMDAITSRFGPSQRAFIIVPLVGAFFLDILNAGAITFFAEIADAWLGADSAP